MPDRQINLRQATADDTPALLSLMDSVLEWLVAHGRTEQWGTVPFSQIPGFPERVTDWVSQDVITLAERNGKCVGLLAAAPLIPPRIPTGLVPEGSMFVHTVMSHRGPDGRDVGSALMNEVERRARTHKAPALALDHWAGSAELARIYDKRGYVKVAEYTADQGEKTVRNVVRVYRLSLECPD
ncbi:GNAT family N-acetyltransferase [Sphaerisporangium perillae]|uniref:GNAT family N-acetyltransferase n=1 Tax=Sphaerisporangium perillae TaxID=2935860 RepID=UPI00200CEDA0|nr:GNAT family N-acetyltransferase [Sphaerisporangium perillae]